MDLFHQVQSRLSSAIAPQIFLNYENFVFFPLPCHLVHESHPFGLLPVPLNHITRLNLLLDLFPLVYTAFVSSPAPLNTLYGGHELRMLQVFRNVAV